MTDVDLNALMDALEAHLETALPDGVLYAVVIVDAASNDTCCNSDMGDADLVEVLRDAADSIAQDAAAFQEPSAKVVLS